MDALDRMTAALGTELTTTDVAAVLGWTTGEAAALIASTDELPVGGTGHVTADDLVRFLRARRQEPRIEAFVPSRADGLLPVAELRRRWIAS